MLSGIICIISPTEYSAIYTCISGFNSSIIAGDSVLVSLDKYLGADCKYYPMEIYSYMAARMTPGYIVPDCMYAWAASDWDFEYMEYPAENVLTRIIHEGSSVFQKCMLPDTPDEIIFGYTSDQMKFCRNNEAQMWQYLIEHDLLFKTDMLTEESSSGMLTSYFQMNRREGLRSGQDSGWLSHMAKFGYHFVN